MKYHALSLALLSAAIFLETMGFAGAPLALATGVGCEVAFWVHAGRRRSSVRRSGSIG